MTERLIKMKKWVITVIAMVFFVAVISFFVYLFFFDSKDCLDLTCYRERMGLCKKTFYIHDDEQAVWLYKIIGENKGQCQINVRLLSAKQGELGIDKLEGMSMDCFFPVGEVNYPEQKLDNCHGRLKEEFQSRIITKLHNVILENLKGFQENLTNSGF
jgi:hypothetical protein